MADFVDAGVREFEVLVELEEEPEAVFEVTTDGAAVCVCVDEAGEAYATDALSMAEITASEDARRSRFEIPVIKNLPPAGSHETLFTVTN